MFPKLCVLSTQSYLALACATVVSVVIAASKTSTTNPAGYTDPKFHRVLLILPVWDPVRAVNWVSIHKLWVHWNGCPCQRMDFESPFLPGLRGMLSRLLCNPKDFVCVGERDELPEGDIRHTAGGTEQPRLCPPTLEGKEPGQQWMEEQRAAWQW